MQTVLEQISQYVYATQDTVLPLENNSPGETANNQYVEKRICRPRR